MTEVKLLTINATGQQSELKSSDFIAVTKLIQSTNETIAPDTSVVVSRKYTINSGFKLTIGLGGVLRII